jgi:hypothetical protein
MRSLVPTGCNAYTKFAHFYIDITVRMYHSEVSLRRFVDTILLEDGPVNIDDDPELDGLRYVDSQTPPLPMPVYHQHTLHVSIRI